MTMTRKDAIKTLRELWRETNNPWYEEVYNMAIEALQAEAVQEAVPTVVRVTMSDGSQYYLEHERDAIQAEAVQGWIPVSEGLPEEENKKYWICTDDGYQCECRWTNVDHFWTDLTTNWHWHIIDVPQYSEVVAWQPLPEPYKGEESTMGQPKSKLKNPCDSLLTDDSEACKEQKSKLDCISRQQAIEVLAHVKKDEQWRTECIDNEIRLIESLSPVTPTERTGEWLHEELIPNTVEGHVHGECSVCHAVRIVDNYCPTCGARMK